MVRIAKRWLWMTDLCLAKLAWLDKTLDPWPSNLSKFLCIKVHTALLQKFLSVSLILGPHLFSLHTYLVMRDKITHLEVNLEIMIRKGCQKRRKREATSHQKRDHRGNHAHYLPNVSSSKLNVDKKVYSKKLLPAGAANHHRHPQSPSGTHGQDSHQHQILRR